MLGCWFELRADRTLRPAAIMGFVVVVVAVGVVVVVVVVVEGGEGS